MGGVVNILTRQAQRKRSGAVKGSFGSGGTVDLSGNYGFKGKRWNSLSSAGWHQAEPYDLNPENVATTGSGHIMGHVWNRSSFRHSDRLTTVSRSSYLQRDQKGVDANDAGAIFDRRNLTENASIALAPSYRVDKDHRLNLTTSFRYFRDQYVSDQRASSALDTAQNTVEKLSQLGAQWTGAASTKHRYTLGAEGFHEDLQTERLATGQNDRFRGAVYAQDEWRPMDSSPDRLRLVIGYRWDGDSQFGDQHSPKLALRFMPHEKLKLRASFGRGFRSPDFKELFLYFENPGAGYVVEGSPDLQPERSNSVNASLELAAHKRFWCFLNLYHNDIDNLINTKEQATAATGATKRYIYHNIDTALTQGLEARSRFRLSNALALEAGYTLTNARDLTRNRALSGRARHRATFDVRYRYRPWKLRFITRGAVVGNRPFFIDETDEKTTLHVAPPHALIDLRVAKKLNSKVSLFATIENLLNEGDPNYLPIQPLTWSAGLSGRL
tara:strand:- start:316 stop:1809 length:1494 start_codon:yes stop_codon:yes gene_type:complete